jgi:L-ascorbate metabolism protein UlaG (beta-lactamase superfamily)
MSEAGLSITYIGGPTVLIELGGMRLVTDPTFDDAGGTYLRRSTLRKLAGPAIPVSGLGRIDAVLLSHHQHADNLDTAGEALLKKAERVVTTVEGAAELGAMHLVWRRGRVRRSKGRMAGQCTLRRLRRDMAHRSSLP